MSHKEHFFLQCTVFTSTKSPVKQTLGFYVENLSIMVQQDCRKCLPGSHKYVALLPCTLQAGLICCLIHEMLLKAITAASRAFTPSQGKAEA